MRLGVLNIIGGGVGEYRVTTPHVFLSKHGVEVEFISDLTAELNCDILFTHIAWLVNADEERFEQNLKYVLDARSKGIKIVVDVDDNWELPSWHFLYNMSKRGYDKKHITVFSISDMITTTTEFLYHKIKPYNKNVHILPNSLDDSILHNKTNNDSEGKIKIIWGGSATHINDMRLIDRSNIMTRLKSHNAQFILAGFNTLVRTPDGETRNIPDQSEWVKYEEIITNKYRLLDASYTKYLSKYDRSPYHKDDMIYIRRWSKDIKNYLSVFSDASIVLAPLVIDNFNRAKSELKIIEAGWNKKPIVCSNIEQYEKVLKNGGGLTFDNKKVHKDLYVKLKYYFDNPNKMTDDGQILYDICNKKFNINLVTLKRKELYDSLI